MTLIFKDTFYTFLFFSILVYNSETNVVWFWSSNSLTFRKENKIYFLNMPNQKKKKKLDSYLDFFTILILVILCYNYFYTHTFAF